MTIVLEFAAHSLGVNLWLAPQLFVSSRLLLLGGMLIIVAVSVWYWRRLPADARRLRLWLVTLRVLVLLLVFLVICDLGIRYQTALPGRVLLAMVPANEVPTTSDVTEEDAVRKTMASLNRAGIKTIRTDGNRGPLSLDQPLPARAILLSDGRVDPMQAEQIVSLLHRSTGGGPVDLLTNLHDDAGPRVTLVNATISGPAFRGVPVKVWCQVHAVGMAGRETVVTVADIAQVSSTARINWTSDDDTRTVSFEVVPKVSGWVEYTASVAEPVAGVTGPRQLISAFVQERQWRVLMFEGEPTAESNFIRRSLEQAGIFQVEYFAQVSRNATVGNQNSDRSNAKNGASPTARLHALLADQVRLDQFECVLIGPTPNSMLSDIEADRLRTWTDHRGGGLIILGGNNFNGSVISPNGRLTPFLPATIDASSFPSPKAERGLGRPVDAESYSTYALVPTLAGADSALSGYAKVRDSSADKRDVLGLALRIGALRAGGTILAVAGDAQAAASEQGSPLIASAQFGSGQVMLFAPADSFKLKVSESVPGADGPFDALWRGLILWTSARSRPASELSLSDDSPSVDLEVVIEILARDAQFSPATIEKASASWELEGGEASGTTHKLNFLPDRERSNIWRATLKPSATGKYLVKASVTTAGGTNLRLEKRFAVVPDVPLELGSAMDTLMRLTHETGGQVYSLKDVDKLAARLKELPRSGEWKTNTWRLRDFWPLAFMIPLLLAGEWLIRRLKL
ncbi:MAG: hypothetical protein ABIP75_00750 [Pyrinomonadaceae bacterium]